VDITDTLSQKNVPPLVCYNFDTRERILIFFGTCVSNKVSNQKTLYLPPQTTCASALPGKMGNTKIAFSLKCCISAVPEINQSLYMISSILLTHDSCSHCCM